MNNSKESSNFWIVNKVDTSTAEILLYGFISTNDVTSSDFVRELKALEKSYAKINIRINSGGGSIFEGFAIFNAIRNSKAEIDTYVDGLAASMGSVIALAGRKVHMSKVARFMTHKPSGVAIGSADVMRQNAELLESLEHTICAIYAAKTGKSTEECRLSYLGNKDKWFNANQALSEKLIDSIYDADPVNIPQNVTDEKSIWSAYSNQFSNRFSLPENPSTQSLVVNNNSYSKKGAQQLLAEAFNQSIINAETLAVLKNQYSDDAGGLACVLSGLKAQRIAYLNSLDYRYLDRHGLLEQLKALSPSSFEEKFKAEFTKSTNQSKY